MGGQRAWLLVALLAAPAASASWAAYGGHEPDNAYDSASFQWRDPPGTAKNRVYFQGYAMVQAGTALNPNAGALGTRNEIPVNEIHSAILGVWADCNGDGYVGMLETAVREYDNALLADRSLCPAFTGGTNSWPAGAFNYNGWVTEFIPIGGSGGDADDDGFDRRIYRDFDAKVWADLGLWSAGGTVRTCTLTAPPRGSAQSTGGLLNHLQCNLATTDRWNQVWRDGLPAFGVQGADPDDTRGLHFDDSDDARQEGHPLHQPTLGSENSGGSPYRLRDCGAPPLARAGDLVNASGAEATTGPLPAAVHNVAVFTPAPQQTGAPEPTVPAAWNVTVEEAFQNCNYGDDRGGDFYGIVEGDFDATMGHDKRASTMNLAFSDGARARAPPFSLIHGGHAGMEDNAGLLTRGDYNAALPAYAAKRAPRTVAFDPSSAALAVAPAYYVSYYAHVGPATGGRGLVTPGGAGTYGSAQCGGATSGVHRGWNCDRNLWYRDPEGGETVETTPPRARPGDLYELRDVDCYDGANHVGMPLGAPSFGNEPCAPPPTGGGP